MTIIEYVKKEIQDLKNQKQIIEKNIENINENVNKLRANWQANDGARQLIEKIIAEKEQQLSIFEKDK